MNRITREMKVVAAAVTSLAVLLWLGTLGTASAAAPSCNAADFTVGGVFDLQGYLACASGAGLPVTGSNNLQIAGIAVGLLVVGIGAIYTSRRHRLSKSL